MLLLEIDEGQIKMSVQPNQAQIIVDLSNSAVMPPCSEKVGFASGKKTPQNQKPTAQNQTPQNLKNCLISNRL